MHPRLSERLGMKYQSSCSDNLNIRISEDDRFARKITKRDQGELKYRLTYESRDPMAEGEAPLGECFPYLNISKIIHCITKYASLVL